MFLAQESLRALLFPDHPYRLNAMGNDASLASIRREDVTEHYRNYVTSSNLVLSIFGDISQETARRLAESLLAAIPRHSAPSLAAPPPQPELPARTKRREPKEQAIVLVGYPGVDIKDPRMDALSVLQKACSGLSSDLGIEVREKRGLVYFVGAFNVAGLVPGLFAFYAGTREEAADEVEQLINEQVERITLQGVREEEWLRAREQILAAHDMSLQNNAELAQVCALNELCGLGYRYSLGMAERMHALTLDAIRDAAASLFQPERRAVSLLLPDKSGPTTEDVNDEPAE
jgi:zinc protease